MPRALLVTMAFPPIAGPASFAAAKAFSQLPGWEVDVVTVDPVMAGLRSDSSLDAYVQNGFARIVRTTPLRGMRSAFFRKAWMAMSAISHVPDLAYLCTSLSDAAKTLDLTSYDALVSWSQPHAAHMAAQCLKPYMPHARWVARMGDPWSNNPYLLPFPSFLSMDRYFERRFLRTVDHVLFPTEEMRDHILAFNPEYADGNLLEKTSILPPCFDPELFPSQSEGRDITRDHVQGEVASPAPYLIRTMGKWYGPRSPEPLFSAVEQWAQAHPERIHALRIECYGQAGTHARSLEQYPLAQQMIYLCGSVPYRESLGLMLGADCLLTLDAPAQENMFLPSKVAEYAGAGKFLAGITPPGATARAIAERGGIWADPTDSSACVDLIAHLVETRPCAPHTSEVPFSKRTIQAILLKALS